MEKAGFKKIQKLLEIFERERHHEILLTMKNLHELSRNPSPYTLLVIPYSLPKEIVEGEHYVIMGNVQSSNDHMTVGKGKYYRCKPTVT